jgi:Protein of unknown function (DUF2283)
MKKIHYSQDVDALLIEASDEPIAYAEESGQAILHFSATDNLVLIEVLDVTEFSREGEIAELISTIQK